MLGRPTTQAYSQGMAAILRRVVLSLWIGSNLFLCPWGCSADSGADGILQIGAYTILDTRTDLTDRARAKQNVEDALIRYPEIDGLVGLWAYNGPAILSALKDAGRESTIAVIAFDEEEDTLLGIEGGDIHGTVVQQPFEFGYQSVRLLAALARNDRSVLPESEILDIPVQVIRRGQVQDFRRHLEALRASADKTQSSSAESGADADPQRPRIGFLTNNASNFWTLARAGVRKAERDFQVDCEIMLPPNGSPEEQKQMLEILQAKGVSGIAISPNDSVNQIPMLNAVAAKVNLICHDSDAPDSDRLCFVGTNNYLAGREAGKLIKEALPEGGELMIFVGRMDAQNAMERRQGILDELAEL